MHRTYQVCKDLCKNIQLFGVQVMEDEIEDSENKNLEYYFICNSMHAFEFSYIVESCLLGATKR